MRPVSHPTRSPVPAMIPLRTTLLASLTLAVGWTAFGPVWSAAPAPKAVASQSDAGDRDPLAVAAVIDKLIDAKLTEANIPASPVCDDAEFIRRASLDIRGRIPSPDRVAGFLADRDPA